AAHGFLANYDYLKGPPPTGPANLHAPAKTRPLIYYWYRQSPRPFVPDQFFPVDYGRWYDFRPARVSPDNPSPVQPGMVSLRMDVVRGKLVYFLAVPPEQLTAEKRSEPEWPDLFDADLVGVNLGTWQTAMPYWTPPVACDWRAAFRAPGAPGGPGL